MLLGRRGLVCWSIKFWLRSACWNNLVCSKAAPIQGCEPYKYIYIHFIYIYNSYYIHIIYIWFTYHLHIIYKLFTYYIHILYIYISYTYYIHIIYILYTYYTHNIYIMYIYIYILCQILEAPRYFFNHDFINTDGWQCFKSVLIDEFSQDGAGPVGDEWTC